MMRTELNAVALAVLLVVLNGCGRSQDAKDDMEPKQTYSLCPKTEHSRQMLYGQLKSLANQNGARFVDRSAGAQQELSALRSDVLKNTGGNPILLMVDKPHEFRISVTNLGLRDKMALTVRLRAKAGSATPVTNFMADLSRFWTIEQVGASVTNDPPC